LQSASATQRSASSGEHVAPLPCAHVQSQTPRSQKGGTHGFPSASQSALMLHDGSAPRVVDVVVGIPGQPERHSGHRRSPLVVRLHREVCPHQPSRERLTTHARLDATPRADEAHGAEVLRGRPSMPTPARSGSSGCEERRQHLDLRPQRSCSAAVCDGRALWNSSREEILHGPFRRAILVGVTTPGEAEGRSYMRSRTLRATALALGRIEVKMLDALATLEGRSRSDVAREAIAALLARCSAPRSAEPDLASGRSPSAGTAARTPARVALMEPEERVS